LVEFLRDTLPERLKVDEDNLQELSAMLTTLPHP